MHLGAGVGAAVGVSVLRGQGVGLPTVKVSFWPGVRKWNGYQFQLEQNELADMFIGIADGTKDETELRYWINDHIE